jgi:hypothetical protein
MNLPYEKNEITKAITVTVDARQCGEGKTWDGSPTAVRFKGRIWSTYSNIKDGWFIGHRYLVVLPGKQLVEKYRKDLTEYLEEEALDAPGGEFERKQLAAITSDEFSNVQRQLHEELNNYTPIIIITQAAFLMSNITSQQKSNYNLIIDEAFMPYREIPVYHNKDCNVDFKWAENTKTLITDDGAAEWPELRFFDLSGNFITDSAEQTRSLHNTNWRCRVNVNDYAKFAAPIPKNEKISVIQELRPEILAGWQTIWIACAAFEYTFMAYWMNLHDIGYKTHHKLPFVKHQVPINIMGPDDLKFTWSSYKQTNEQNLIEQYKEQVEPIAGLDKVLVLRNNNQERQVFQNEEKLPHNSAGGNGWRECEYISLESALNPTPNMSRFLYDVYGIGGEREYDKVHVAQTVYTFYQTVMRSCLRDGKPATVFCLDNRVIMGLAEFFENINFNEIRLVRSKELEDSGRPLGSGLSTNLGRALTGAERAFIAKKRRYTQYKSMTNDEILSLRN